MDTGRLGMRLAVAGVVSVVALMLTAPLLGDRPPVYPNSAPIRMESTGSSGDGADLAAPIPVLRPTDFGVQSGSWEGSPILLFTVHERLVEEATASHGHAGIPATAPHPLSDDHVLIAFSAWSPFHGCTLSWRPWESFTTRLPDYDGDGLSDGAMFDPCHHGMWDPLADGRPVAGLTRDVRLAQLHIEPTLVDGSWRVHGTHFDGPIGPPDR